MSSRPAQRSLARRPWLRPVASSVILVLLGLELIYAVTANTILATKSLDHWLTGATPGLSLKIESGWTLWPGRVHVKSVELHFEDHNIQFSVSMDAAVVDLRLWQLPMKTFHLTRVRAEGVHCLLRHKVSDVEGIERRLALYPKIAGFSDPPLFKEPKAPPLTDKQYNLWTIHLEDVDAGVKELWFLEYRFTGAGRAKGGFRLEPERDARTDLCTLTLDGMLRVGEQTVASPLRGRIQAQLDRHDPRVVEGAKIFTKISFDTDLRATIPNLEFTDLYAEADGPHLSRGQGTLRARATLKHGGWMKPTQLRYETEAVTFSQEHLVVAGALALGADIVKGGKDSVMELSAASARLKASYLGSPKALEGPSVRDLRVVSGVSADLAREIRLISLDARIKAEVPQMRWINYPLNSKELFAAGSARANATLEWAQGKPANGKATLEVTNASFDLVERTMQVSGSADAVLSYDPALQRGHFRRLGLDIPQLAVWAKSTWTPLPGGLHAHAERLGWQGLPPNRFQGRFELNSETIAPLVPLVISSAIVRSIATALVRLGKTHAVLEVDRTPAALVLNMQEFQSGDLRANGILRNQKDQPHPCGRFLLTCTNLSVGIVVNGGETSIKPFVSSNWWRERPPTVSCGPEPANDRKTLANSTRARRVSSSED